MKSAEQEASKTLRLGTRASDLAQSQSMLVVQALEAKTGCSIELVPVQTSGDSKQGAGESVQRDKKEWILELEQMLIDGEIDFAIHSAKDVPIDIDAQTSLVSVLPRADARDALLLSDASSDRGSATDHLRSLNADGVIACASKRRRAQLLRLGLAGSVVPIRGNVPTRIQRMKDSSELDGLVLASAGLHRLGLQDEVAAFFEVDEMLPAVHQGTLCAQYISTNVGLGEMLSMVSDRATQLAWEAERCVIEKLGADCGSCVAVYANLNANQVRLRAQVFSADGRSLIEDEGVAPAKDVRNLGLGIGDSLLRAGAADLL